MHGAGAYDSHTRAIEGSATAEGLRLAQLPLLPPSAKGLDGRLGASLTLSGTTDAPAGELRASVEQATVDGSPLPGLLLTARSDGAPAVGSPAATLGDPPGRDGSPRRFLRGSGSFEGDGLRADRGRRRGAARCRRCLDALPADARSRRTAKAQGRLVIEIPLRDPKALRYSGEGLMASGQLRELEWSTQEFRVDGNAEEAEVAGLRLSTTSRLPGSRQRTEAERAGAPAAPRRRARPPRTGRPAAAR